LTGHTSCEPYFLIKFDNNTAEQKPEDINLINSLVFPRLSLSSETCTVQGVIGERESGEKETMELAFEILHDRMKMSASLFQFWALTVKLR
jgi:hypothetical protein